MAGLEADNLLCVALLCQLHFIATFLESRAGLEITIGHWPFSDQFQHLADQNPFWSANFTIHFQWDQ